MLRAARLMHVEIIAIPKDGVLLLVLILILEIHHIATLMAVGVLQVDSVLMLKGNILTGGCPGTYSAGVWTTMARLTTNTRQEFPKNLAGARHDTGRLLMIFGVKVIAAQTGRWPGSTPQPPRGFAGHAWR